MENAIIVVQICYHLLIWIVVHYIVKAIGNQGYNKIIERKMVKCIVYRIALIGTTFGNVPKKPRAYGHRTNKALLSKKGRKEETEEDKKRFFVLNGIGRSFSFLTPLVENHSGETDYYPTDGPADTDPSRVLC